MTCAILDHPLAHPRVSHGLIGPIANWGDAAYSDYAVGFIGNLSSPRLKFICRTGFAGWAPEVPQALSPPSSAKAALVGAVSQLPTLLDS
jgi:hypothetical protein